MGFLILLYIEMPEEHLPDMALNPTHLIVTHFAYVKAAPPAAAGLTRCSVP